MSVAQEIGTAAGEVRAQIAANAARGSESLVRFARQFARSSQPRNAALAIKVSLSSAEDPEAVESLKRRMLETVKQVLAEQPEGKDGVDVADEARQRLFVRYRRELPKREVICRTDGLEKHFKRTGFTMGPVSMELSGGEITALVGGNAQGKTTLLRSLIGEYHPSAGSVSFPELSASSRVSWGQVAGRIGYLPQKLPDWHGSLTDMLYFQAALRGLGTADAEDEIRYVTARLDLTGELDKRWSELSGGVQLKFALGQALVGRPRLLVLDEPLANLDLPSQAKLVWDIRHLAKSVDNPMGVVISSQVLKPLEAIADSVLFLREGKVVFQGPRRALGTGRKFNVYECDTSLSLSALKARIGDQVEDIRHTGVTYYIKTPLSVSYNDMYRILTDADVEFTQLGDIGRTLPSLFELDVS